MITNHHLLMDGWSAPVLVRELFQLYAQQGRCRGAAAGYALSQLSLVPRGAGSRERRGGLAGGAGWS